MGRGKGEENGPQGAEPRGGSEGDLESKAAALVGLIETYSDEGRSAAEVMTSSQFAELQKELSRRGSY